MNNLLPASLKIRCFQVAVYNPHIESHTVKPGKTPNSPVLNANKARIRRLKRSRLVGFA